MAKFTRALAIFCLAAAVLAAGAAFAGAADVSQEAKYLWDGNWRVRGNNPPVAGLYLGWAKIAAMWVVFVAWAWVADWANRDMDDNNLNWQMWNPVIVGSFMGTLLLTWIVPWFWLNVFLLLGAAVGPLAAFVVQRNGQLPSHQHVFTRATCGTGFPIG